MTATMKVRKWWASYRCIHTAEQPKVKARIWDRNRGWTPTGCIEAWAALEAALTETGYGTPKRAWVDRKCPIGIEGRPCQKSGVDCSLHNYGLAIDIDPAKNPHFQQRFGKDWSFSDVLITRSQVEAVEAIKTDSGVQVFKWLGWSIGDTMHFEITCRPEDLASEVPVTGSGARSGQMERVELQEEEDVFTAEEE